MTDFKLTKTRIQAGVYEGVISTASNDAAHDPIVTVYLLEEEVGDVTISEDPTLAQTWHLKIRIPSDVLTDGIQTFLIYDVRGDEKLDSFTIITGEPLNDDLQAEVDLLRAELDMLKKAFRRHCVETT
jgi:hypothetical protein